MDTGNIDINVPANTGMIANPLPMPKRHVKKEMDYDIDVPETLMFFDYEVDPDDQFDR